MIKKTSAVSSLSAVEEVRNGVEGLMDGRRKSFSRSLRNTSCVSDAAAISEESSGQLIIEHVPGIETEVVVVVGGARGGGVASPACSLQPFHFQISSTGLCNAATALRRSAIATV